MTREINSKGQEEVLGYWGVICCQIVGGDFRAVERVQDVSFSELARLCVAEVQSCPGRMQRVY